MDELQAVSLPHIVQMYTSTCVTSSKVQNQIIISHSPHEGGKLTYHSLSGASGAGHSQLLMSCPQALHGVTPLNAQVLQENELGQLFPSLVLPSPYKPLMLEAPQCTPHAPHPSHATFAPYDVFVRENCIVAKLQPQSQPVEQITECKSENTSPNEQPRKKRSRGVVPDPTRWACNVRKKSHQRGEGYVSRRGKQVPPRRVTNRKDCLTSCKYKCNEQINDTDRELIFKAFYSLNANEKKHFLLNTTERHNIKQSKMTTLKRQFSFKYLFIVRGVRHVVCKNFYLGTLAISQKPVYNVHLGKSEMNLPKPDGRGQSSASIHALPAEVKETVRRHIESFKTVDSKPIQQFSRKKQYLQPGVTVKAMYAMYCGSSDSARDGGGADAGIHRVRDGGGADAGIHRVRDGGGADAGKCRVRESMYRRIARLEYNLHSRPKTLCFKCKEPVKVK